MTKLAIVKKRPRPSEIGDFLNRRVEMELEDVGIQIAIAREIWRANRDMVESPELCEPYRSVLLRAGVDCGPGAREEMPILSHDEIRTHAAARPLRKRLRKETIVHIKGTVRRTQKRGDCREPHSDDCSQPAKRVIGRSDGRVYCAAVPRREGKT